MKLTINSIKNSIFFDNDVEIATFYDRLNLRGFFQYEQAYKYLKSFNEKITYKDFSQVFISDKSLRDGLYVYFAALEEMLRNQLLNNYNIKTLSTIRSLEQFQKHSPYKINKIENNNLYKSLKCTFGVLIAILEMTKIYNKKEIKDLEILRDIRNDVMHHNFILLKDYEKFEEVEKYVNGNLKNNLFLFEKFVPGTMFVEIYKLYNSKVKSMLKK